MSSRRTQNCACATMATRVRRSGGGASGKKWGVSGEGIGPREWGRSRRCWGVRLPLRGEAGTSHLLSLRSAVDFASRAGDGPGSRAGVPGAAVTSALGRCGSTGLGAHGWRPPFPCRGEGAALRGGTKGTRGRGSCPLLPASPLQIHVVHLSTAFAEVEEALGRPGGLAVLAAFLQVPGLDSSHSLLPHALRLSVSCPQRPHPSILTLAPGYYPHSLISSFIKHPL